MRSSSQRWPHFGHTWILLVAELHAVTNPQFGQWCSFAISGPRDAASRLIAFEPCSEAENL